MLLLKDIDECLDASACDHNCTNEKGSFTCSCAVGYRLGNDGKSCTGTEGFHFFLAPLASFFIFGIFQWFFSDFFKGSIKKFITEYHIWNIK